MADDGNCAPTILSRTESVGLAFFAETGILSASSLVILIILIIRNIVRYRKYANSYKWNLVEQPADVYVLSLFIADVLQSIGASMSARWVHDGTVSAGHYCTAQGLIQELGETSVGLATMCIAIHTFVTVWMRKEYRVRTAVIIVAIAWTFMALFVGVAASKHRNYVEPSPFWCWVGPGYKQERLFGEYFWLWLTLFVAITVYVPLFLWNQGYISIDEKHWWKVTWHWKTTGEDGHARERPVASSLKLLAYPLAYSIVVLPLSIVRWITFSEQGCGRSSVPAAATFAAASIHGCFGFVNVMLLLTTRQTLLLFDDPRNPRQLRLRRTSRIVLRDWDGDPEARLGRDGGAKGKRPSTQSGRGSLRGSRRAASLDSSKDALGVILKEMGRVAGSGIGVDGVSSTPSPRPSEAQKGSSSSSNDIHEGKSGTRRLREQQPGSTRVFANQQTLSHLKTSGGRSAHRRRAAGATEVGEQSNKNVSVRLAQMTSSQTMVTNMATITSC